MKPFVEVLHVPPFRHGADKHGLDFVDVFVVVLVVEEVLDMTLMRQW